MSLPKLIRRMCQRCIHPQHPFYLHTVGDDWERSSLVAKKERCLLALRRIEAAEHEGRIVQPRQRELYECWIVEIDRLLATSKNS